MLSASVITDTDWNWKNIIHFDKNKPPYKYISFFMDWKTSHRDLSSALHPREPGGENAKCWQYYQFKKYMKKICFTSKY